MTIHEAKTRLSRLIERALAGEEITVAKGKEPLVSLVPLSEQQKGRRIGGEKGNLEYMADDFDTPLDDFENYTG